MHTQYYIYIHTYHLSLDPSREHAYHSTYTRTLIPSTTTSTPWFTSTHTSLHTNTVTTNTINTIPHCIYITMLHMTNVCYDLLYIYISCVVFHAFVFGVVFISCCVLCLSSVVCACVCVFVLCVLSLCVLSVGSDLGSPGPIWGLGWSLWDYKRGSTSGRPPVEVLRYIYFLARAPYS